MLVAATLALVSTGCRPETEPTEGWVSIPLSSFVLHQQRNVSSDLISAPEGLGLENLDYGLRLRQPDDGRQACLEITESLARLALFSADADLSTLELELGLGGDIGPKRVKLNLRLNGKKLARIHMRQGWSSHRLEVPAALVQTGPNLLELVPRPTSLQRTRLEPPVVCIRRLRLRPASGREIWLQRPQTIKSADGADPSVEMPSASFLDMVVTLPDRAFFRASYTLHPAPDRAFHEATVYLRLLRQGEPERELYSQRLRGPMRRPKRLQIDLRFWAGEIVRLRLGVSGPSNAIARWTDARIDSPEPAASLPPARLIERLAVTATGRLGQPDVLMILLDAARADAFSPFGGLHPTPAAERLAVSGTVFTRALATAPWTGQSVPSIFTGLYADALGIGPWGSRIPQGMSTLAEMMAHRGYRTVLWSQHPFYRNHTGFKRGFEEFYRSPHGETSALPNRDHLVSSERPTFAFVHLLPPHTPYEPPKPFRGAYSSWYRGGISVAAPFLNSFPLRSDPHDLSADDLRYIRDRYLEHAAYADHLVGRLLTLLEEAGRLDNALVVLLSDHGEAFLEHGRFLHTQYLHHEYLHVPLIIKWPLSIDGFEPRIEETVSLADLAPTLVDGLSLPAAETGFQGRSLLPMVFDRTSSPRPHYANTLGVADRHRTPSPSVMMEAEGWKVIYRLTEHEASLFNIAEDPHETTDLAPGRPLRTLLLRQSVLMQAALNSYLFRLEGEQESTEEELDPELIEQLEALGYLN